MKYSGSSGIRAKWGEELLEVARELGLSLGKNYSKVVVGADFRESSEALKSMVMGALLSGGAEVYDAGNVPTPTLAYAARNFDAGLMITASHNPPEYNGIKLWNPDGSAFSEEQMSELNGKGVADWDSTGSVNAIDALSEHRDAILRVSKGLDGLKVLIDCSNGAGSVITPYLLRELGADVLTLNCHPDGTFPGHPSEPSEKNLELLKKMVVKKGADIGIAHDGDADRFIAISSSGRYLDGDKIMAIFIKSMGFKKVVVPVNSSMLIDSVASDVIRCPVGDANVSRVIKETGYEFGGEQSGTQIFSSWRYTPDAIYSAVKFSEIAMREDIDEMLSSFPEYITIRKSVMYKDREEMERKIERYIAGMEVDKTDGWRVNMDDLWFLIRFSGTEPKVRITVETDDRAKAERMMDDIYNALGGA